MNSNNDLMDPNWKPDLVQLKSDPIEKIKCFIRVCDKLVSSLGDIPKPEPYDKEKGFEEIKFYNVRISSKMAHEIVDAYKEVEFK